jgi:hypothetical protein
MNSTITAVCSQCGATTRLADETCSKCGAEVNTVLRTVDYSSVEQLPRLNDEKEFKTEPIIGPFVSIGSAIGSTLSLFTSNLWLITKIVFVVFAPYEIFKALSLGTPEMNWQTGAGTFLLNLFCKALVAPSLIFALVTVMRTGVAPSLSEAYRWGLSRLGKLIACAAMAWILQFLGFILFIVPGIILGLAFELVYPMATLENRKPVEILKRSCRLTRGFRLRIFFTTLVFGLICMVVAVPATGLAAMMVAGGIHFWPIDVVLALIADIASQATTVLSLVIYLGIVRFVSSE